MVTPLMLLLSSINSDLGYDHPVDVMYLNRSDRTIILGEADRLGRMVCDHNYIGMSEDAFGNPVVDTAQEVNGRFVEISQATAMLLTRLQECYQRFKKANAAALAEDETADLGMDAVILRLEGNPKFVYIYVYNMMESKGLEYSMKIGKLAEVYDAIIGHSQVSANTDKYQFLMNRFELHSSKQFWERLLVADGMKHNAGAVTVGSEELAVMKRELKDLGFYGFVNPKKMYDDFVGARVNRKVEVNVADEVTDYLRKVVKSGGVEVA